MHNKKTRLILTLILALLIIVNFTPIKVNAHNAYHLSFVYDESTGMFTSLVKYEKNSTLSGLLGGIDALPSAHRDSIVGAVLNNISAADAVNDLPYVNSNNLEGRIGGYWLIADTTHATLPNGTITEENYQSKFKIDTVENGTYTFPPSHVFTCYRNATDDDNSRASWIGDTLSSSLNDILSTIYAFEKINSSTTNTTNVRLNIATAVANAAYKITNNSSSSYSLDLNSFYSNCKYIYTLKKVTPSEFNEVFKKLPTEAESGDFVLLEVKDASGKILSTEYFRTRVKKGYINGPLSGTIHKVSDLESRGEPEYLTWKHLVFQAQINKIFFSIDTSNIDDLYKLSDVEEALLSFFSNLISSAKQAFGLYPLSELTLNTGSRASNYYNGIMPNGLFKGSMLVFGTCMIIAWLLLLGSLVQLFLKRNLASISNTQSRIDFAEGIKSCLFAGVLLVLIIPFFYAITTLNVNLVDVFAKTSEGTILFGETASSRYGGFGRIMVESCLLFISFYFNYTYIVRGLVVTILFATSPLFVVSSSYGGQYKGLFTGWLKELIANVFMQSFHAICIAVFSPIVLSGSSRTFEALVLYFCFIPLTKFFQESLMKLSTDTTAISQKGLSSHIGAAVGLGGVIAAGSSALFNNDKKSSKSSKSSTMNSSDSMDGCTPKTGFEANEMIDKDSNLISPGGQKLSTQRKKEGLGASLQNISTSVGKNAPKVLGTAAKTAFNLAGIAGGAVMAIGSGAIGDNATRAAGLSMMKNGAGNIGSSLGGATRSTFSPNSNNNSKDGDLDMFTAQDYGYMYSNDLGNGISENKFAAENYNSSFGFSDVQGTDDYIISTLNTDTPYSGDPNNIALPEGITDPNVSENLKSLIGAYRNPQDQNSAATIKKWADQGITVKLTDYKDENGVDKCKTQIIQNKKKTDVDSFHKIGRGSDSTYIFRNKNGNTDFAFSSLAKKQN